MGGRTVTYTLRADTDNFEAGFKRAKTTAQDLFSSIGKDAERLVNGRKLAAAFKDIGKEMTAAFTLPIVGAFGAVLTASQGFDREMTKSMAIMGNVSTETRKKLEDNARNVAKTFGVAHEDAAKSYYSLASAGLTAEQSMKALPLVAQFAKAGMMEMGAAADLLTGSQVALGLSFADPIRNATEMKRVSDVLVQANNFALGSTEEFAAALSNKAGAAMRQYGQSVEAGTAVLMAFAAQNVRGQTAGEQYAIAIRELARAGLAHADAFARAKIAVFDSSGAMRNMADILGDVEKRFAGMSTEARVAELNMLGIKAKTQGAILPLIGMSDAIRGYETALKSASGATADVAAKQMKSFAEQMNLLKAAVTDVAISLGQTLLPIAQRVVSFAKSELVPAVQGAVDKFKALPEGAQNGVIGLAALLAAAGPLIWTFGQVATGVGTMVTAFKTLAATNAITWLIGITTAFTGLPGVIGVATAAAYSFLQVGLAGAAGYALGSVLRDLIDNYFPKVGKWLDDLIQKAYDWWTGMTNAQRATGKGAPVGALSFPEGRKSHDTGITSYGFDWSSPEGKAKLDAMERAAQTSASATVVAFGAISTSATAAAAPVANLTGGVNTLTKSLTKAQQAAEIFESRVPGGPNSAWGSGISFTPFWGGEGGALPPEIAADLAKVKSRSKLDPHLSASALQTGNRTLFNVATKDTATFSQALQNLSNVFNLATHSTGKLGSAARTLASVAGGGSGIAGGLGSLFGIGGQQKQNFGTGLTGLLGKAGMYGQIASSALSIGSAIFGLFKKKPKEPPPPPPKEVDAATWKNFQGEQLSKGTSGLAAGVGGIQLTSSADLTSQATIAGLQFWSIFKTQGLTAAADATKGVISKLVENLSQYGSEAATAVLAPIQQQIALASNDAFRGASEGAKGFADVLASQVNARMPMTIEQFGAFGQQAMAAFEQAKAGAIATGLSTEEATRAALQAVGPLVTTAVDAAGTYGFAIDANTQSLLDQAAASGVAFATDKTDRLVMSIDALTTALGGVPPAVNAITGAINNIPRDVQVNVHTNQTGGTTGPNPGDGSGLDGPGFASGSGGLRNFGIETRARLHGREAVLTEPQFTSLTRAAQAGNTMSVSFGDIHIVANDEQGGRDAAEEFIRLLDNGSLLTTVKDRLGIKR